MTSTWAASEMNESRAELFWTSQTLIWVLSKTRPFQPEEHANRDKKEQKRYKKKSGENVKIFGWTTFNDPQTTQKCRARASEKRVRKIRSCEINLVENSFIVLHIHSPLVLSSSLARSYLFPFVRENIKTQNKRERDERRRETCNTSFERFLSFS